MRPIHGVQVAVPTLNLQRAELLFKALLRPADDGSLPRGLPAPLTPDQIADVETFVQKYQSVIDADLVLDANLAELLAAGRLSAAALGDILGHKGLAQPERYYIGVLGGRAGAAGGTSSAIGNTGDGAGRAVGLWFDDAAEPGDRIAGLFHACVLRLMLGSPAGRSTSSPKLLARSHRYTIDRIDGVATSLTNAGWNLEQTFFPSEQAVSLAEKH